MKLKNKVVFILFLVAIISGCNCGKNRQKVNLTGTEVELKIHRLDVEIFKMKTENIHSDFSVMDSAYHSFLSFYTDQILGLGNYKLKPQLTVQKFSDYLNDPYVNEVRDSCQRLFGDFEPQRKELAKAMQYVKHYFPEKRIPEIVTFISNFSYSAITFDTLYVGIGLDMYLGKDFKYYQSLFPKYLYEKFSQEYLTANCVKALASLYFNFDPKDNKLISQMVANGIALYFTDLILPDEDDYKKISYNPEDIQWCIMNEPEIWKYLIDRELLYSSNAETNKIYVNPGPSTSGMPRESPGNVGSWIGWQIVRAYMKKFPETKFEDLLAKSPQEMLVKSGYKPGRNLF